jgi:hypothetical protein
VLYRVVTAGMLALGTGMALAETPAQDPSSHQVDCVVSAVADASGVPHCTDFNAFSLPYDADPADAFDPSRAGSAVFYRFGAVAQNTADDDGAARFDGLLPLAYTQLRTDLPWPALRNVAQANPLGGQRDALVDATVLLGWSSDTGIAFEGGYRRYLLKIVNSNPFDRRAVDLSGPYATLSLRF